MAVKKLKLNLPVKGPVDLDLEETITAGVLLNYLKTKEILNSNGQYEIRKTTGEIIHTSTTIGKLREPIYDVVNPNDTEKNDQSQEDILFDIPSIPRYFHQLGILVLDGSGSMTEKAEGNSSKAKEVNAAVIELFNRLNASRVKQNFSFACIKFDNDPTLAMQPVEFDYSKLMNENYDPTIGKGGGTEIFKALSAAGSLAQNFLDSASNDDVPHKVLILLMTDGMCFEPNKSISVADDLKSNPKIQIASAYFSKIGDKNQDAENLLMEVSTDSSYYTNVQDGEALRAFFERSISQSAGVNI